MIPLTTHTIVKNEDQWIWYALMSFKNFAKEMLVVDDNSTDKTREVINTIDSAKIKFESAVLAQPGDLTAMRNKMIQRTKTEWFLILDGDEIWSEGTIAEFSNFLEKQPSHIYAVTMRTRNCIGDVYHYLPESSGRYSIMGIKGNLNIRAYRKLPGFQFIGDYPLEAYCDSEGKSINNQDEHLAFFDHYYWHMTFLPRSSDRSQVKGWRSKKTELGYEVVDLKEFPEVFSMERPAIVPDPWRKMESTELIKAAALTPFKKLKRTFIK